MSDMRISPRQPVIPRAPSAPEAPPAQSQGTEVLRSPGSLRVSGEGPEDRRLRAAAQQLEGVFVEQLFKAMRETVPEGGMTDGGFGEDVFSDMLDSNLAVEASHGWERGLGAALYRQLRGTLAQPPATAGEGEK